MLRQYFNCNERLEIFLTCFCDILCYVGPHSTERFRQYCRNITWKYCKIAKIFRNLLLILLKYCNNLAMSAQNMTLQYFPNIAKPSKCINNVFFK